MKRHDRSSTRAATTGVLLLLATTLAMMMELVISVPSDNNCSLWSDCDSCLSARGSDDVESECQWCPEDEKCWSTKKSTTLVSHHNESNIFDSSSSSACATPQSYATTCPLTNSELLDEDKMSTDNIILLSEDSEGFLGETIPQLSSSTMFDDENYGDDMWAFEMINIFPAWDKGYRGKGVRVRINDGGIDRSHVEFEGRVDLEASCPLNMREYENAPMHGTAVASIVGAAANNKQCSVGVAPEVFISTCYALDPTDRFFRYKLDTIDISQNSWERPVCSMSGPDDSRRGLELSAELSSSCPFRTDMGIPTDHPCDVCDGQFQVVSKECEMSIFKHCRANYENDVDGCSEFLDIMIGSDGCEYYSLSDTARDALSYGTQYGRDGKGVIFVFASGNAYFRGDWTNTKPFTNSRFTISVGAVGHDGRHASYSGPGPNLFVSAPGGDTDSDSRAHPRFAALAGGGCGNPGMGTSFSAPVISGVVALMLEANPNLKWRDVQGILATTSRPVTQFAGDTSATRNGAGLWHSNLYGFGLVDAAAAVEAAEQWSLYGPEEMIAEESVPINLPIVDDAGLAVSSTIDINREDFVVESVVVYLDIQHQSRGDLDIVLTSPAGTESVLHPGKLPENTQLDVGDRWKLLTVRNWGEQVFGTWSLTIRDEKAGYFGTGNCIDGPFELTYKDVFVNCQYMEYFAICENGAMKDEFFVGGIFGQLRDAVDEDNGRTVSEQCCVCGGGTLRENFSDELRQWRLVVYGTSSADLISLDDLSASTVVPNTSAPSTTNPTAAPSPAPSRTPTLVPTISPTGFPTLNPTDLPSSLPTGPPTVTHSNTPSSFPSTSPTKPTIPPTTSPSISPSMSPTRLRTPSPTLTPTGTPSTTPSQWPTTYPTISWSSSPSSPPSGTPTQSPTQFASTEPSSTPTTAPSEPPSSNPTELASVAPTMKPSSTPTTSPSLRPTGIPSLLPSYNPTISPTSVPSSAPTEPTSMNPTYFPSTLRSIAPVTPFNTEENTAGSASRGSIPKINQEEIAASDKPTNNNETPLDETVLPAPPLVGFRSGPGAQDVGQNLKKTLSPKVNRPASSDGAIPTFHGSLIAVLSCLVVWFIFCFA